MVFEYSDGCDCDGRRMVAALAAAAMVICCGDGHWWRWLEADDDDGEEEDHDDDGVGRRRKRSLWPKMKRDSKEGRVKEMMGGMARCIKLTITAYTQQFNSATPVKLWNKLANAMIWRLFSKDTFLEDILFEKPKEII